MDDLIKECCSKEVNQEQEPLFKALFTEDDIKDIVSLRKGIENNIVENPTCKSSFLGYISLELKILRKVESLCMERCTDASEDHLQKGTFDYLKIRIKSQINKVYKLILRSFPFDLSLWFSYIEFCKVHKMPDAVGPVLDEMLQLQGSSTADMYQLPAECVRNNCMSVEKARKYLLEGINVHKDDRKLLELAFYLELENAARQRKQREACKEEKVPIDLVNPDFTADNAKSIYIGFILKLKDAELMNKLMTICSNYDFAKGLETRIFSDLMDLEVNERIHEILANKQLECDPEEKLTKLKISKCVETFEKAVKELNTHLMWSFYIETLMKLYQDTTVWKKYIYRQLVTAFLKAAKEKKVTEEQYITLATELKAPKKQAKLVVEVLQLATKQYPQSFVLWEKLIRTPLQKNKVNQAYKAFYQATKVFGKDYMCLWMVMFNYEKTRGKTEVEQLFKESLSKCPEISDSLKVKFLQWAFKSTGICAARKVYQELVDLRPLSLQLHRRMADLEHGRPIKNRKRIRVVLDRACKDFGKDDTGVWIDLCIFEWTFGQANRLSRIYNRALRNLNPQHLEHFRGVCSDLKIFD